MPVKWTAGVREAQIHTLPSLTRAEIVTLLDSHPKRHISGVGSGGIMPTPQTMDLQVRRSYMAVSMVGTAVFLEQSLFS